MYQKIKYIIIATMFLLICVVVLTLDANTRYNAIKKEQGQSTQQTSAQSYTQQQNQYTPTNSSNNSYGDSMRYKNRNLNNQSATTDENEEEEEENSYNNNPYSRNASLNNQNIPQEYKFPNSFQENTTEDKPKTLEILDAPNAGYLADTTGKKSDNYKLEKVFKLNQEEYAIISDTNNTNLSSSSYCQKKFYIYKKVDNAYKMSNYLFDITESTNAGPAQITIEDSDGTLIINYSGSTHLKRTVDNYQLKSSYRQFESTYPALIYNEPPQEEIQQQNSLDLQP